MFLLSADKNQLRTLESEPITSGSVNVYEVKFQFDSDWEDMERIAVFRVGSESVTVLLDDGNRCNIPYECMRANDVGKKLYAGVYGMIGDSVVLPTIWSSLGEIRQGTTLGAAAMPPTPSLTDQALAKLAAMLAQAEATVQQAAAAAERAEAAAEKAESGSAGGGESGGDIATDEEVSDAIDGVFGT